MVQAAAGKRVAAVYWLITGFLILWALASASIYINLFVKTPEEFAADAETPEKQAAYAQYIADMPAWALVLGIGAALTRVLGGLCLLLRRKWASTLYLLSLVLFVASLFRAFVLANAAEAMSGPHIATQGVFVALNVLALWFVRWSDSRGILR
jgi:hypothetical protein